MTIPAQTKLRDIHDKINALGGSPEQNNSYDQGIVDTVAKALEIIEEVQTALAARPQAEETPLGPCTQAEINAWEKEKDSKTGRLLLAWMDRALKAEEALAAVTRPERCGGAA